MTPILGIMASQISGHLSPIPLTNLKLWLDASLTSTITQSGGLVSQWNDRSVNGNNVVQATGAKQPTTGTRTINSLNTLDWTATKGMTSSAANTVWSFASNSTGSTTFIVGQFDTTAALNTLATTYDGTTGNNGFIMYANSTPKYAAYVGGTTGVNIGNVSTSTPGTTNPFLMVVQNDPTNGTASARSKMYINSGGAEQNNTSTIAVSASAPAYTLHVGNFNGFTDGLDGRMAEIIMYSGLLSSGDIATVQAYLKTKWGTP